jgi:hypothetical protein
MGRFELEESWTRVGTLPDALTRQVASGLAAKQEAGLAKALGERLGLGRPAGVSDMLSLAGRIGAVSQEGREWFYLDGECFFGLGPVESRMDLGDAGDRVVLVFKRQQLDPEGAPPYPVRT